MYLYRSSTESHFRNVCVTEADFTQWVNSMQMDLLDSRVKADEGMVSILSSIRSMERRVDNWKVFALTGTRGCWMNHTPHSETWTDWPEFTGRNWIQEIEGHDAGEDTGGR